MRRFFSRVVPAKIVRALQLRDIDRAIAAQNIANKEFARKIFQNKELEGAAIAFARA